MLNDHVRNEDAYDYLDNELFKNCSEHEIVNQLKRIHKMNG